jgi:predicted porin
MMAQATEKPGFTIQKGDNWITLYGVLDAGVARVDHTLGFDPYNSAEVNVTANKPGNTAATGMFNGGISPSRWGLKGGTGINDEFNAIFLLESGINVPDGTVSNGALGVAQTPATAAGPFNSNDSSVSGQLFGRGAWFGVESKDYGVLTLGRQQSIMLDVIGGYDALQAAQLFTPIGFSGSYGGGGATDNSRVDYAVKYRIKIGDFNVGLLHKFGGVTNDANAKSAEQVNLGYEHGNFGVQAVYQGYKDATSLAYTGAAANPNAIKATFFDTTSIMIAAKYQIGELAIKGGYQRQNFTNPGDPNQDLQLTSIYGNPVTAWSVTPYTSGEKQLNVYWIGVNYNLTSKLNAGVGTYQVQQNNFNGNGVAYSAGNGSGRSKYNSVLLDYRFTKSFDTYTGYMSNAVSGGMAVGYANTNNSVFGLGARLSF